MDSANSFFLTLLIHYRVLTTYLPYRLGRKLRQKTIPARYLAFYEMWDFYPDKQMQMKLAIWRDNYSQRATANAFVEHYPDIATRNGIFPESSYDGYNLHRYISAIKGDRDA